MKLVVFGATGRTGHLVVQRALDQGHDVVAYARHPEKLRIQQAHLTVVKGELNDAPAIEQAVRGADVVIELVGAVSEGTETILAAMKKHGVRRIIAASALSVADPRDRFDPRREMLFLFVRLVIPHLVRQAIRAGGLVQNSGLDWTLVRIPGLSDSPATGRIRSGYMGMGTVGFRLTRGDLAAFILEQVNDTTYLQAAPAISSS